MIDKPYNHVSGGRPQDIAKPKRYADLSEELLASLEATHPPRCLARDQTVEDHLRYAGKVELIASMRIQFEAMLQEQRDAPDENTELSLNGAERA